MTDLFATTLSWLVYGGFIVLQSSVLFFLMFLFAAFVCQDLDKRRPSRPCVLAAVAAAISLSALVIGVISDPPCGLRLDQWLGNLILILGVVETPALAIMGFYPERDEADPKLDPSELPLEVLEPVRPWLREYLRTPRFQRHIRWGWINFEFCIPRSRLIRHGELKQLIIRCSNLVRESAHLKREQADELKAQQQHDLERARVEYLNSLTPKERGLLGAQLAARALPDGSAECKQPTVVGERDALAQQLRDRTSEREALEKQIKRLLEEKRAQNKERELAAGRALNLIAENCRLSKENARLRQGCGREANHRLTRNGTQTST